MRLRVKQLICESLNGMRITGTILAAAICFLERDARMQVPWKAQGRELEHRDCGAIPAVDLRKVGRPRGCGGGGGSGKCLCRKPERAALESLTRVEPSLLTLCPHTSALDSEIPQREAGLLLPLQGREPGTVEKARPQRRSESSCQRPGGDPGRARAPSAETAGVPAHSAPPEFPRSEQLSHPHAGSPLGPSCQRLEKALS